MFALELWSCDLNRTHVSFFCDEWTVMNELADPYEHDTLDFSVRVANCLEQKHKTK